METEEGIVLWRMGRSDGYVLAMGGEAEEGRLTHEYVCVEPGEGVKDV